MNSKSPRSKIGLIDHEINFLSKVLFVLMVIISGIIVSLEGFVGSWYFKFFRFILLLSSIIPISLRVNLDLAKIYYSYCISNDRTINGTIARNSSIPEELGRI
jgi:phospholipid-translocating ATPase